MKFFKNRSAYSWFFKGRWFVRTAVRSLATLYIIFWIVPMATTTQLVPHLVSVQHSTATFEKIHKARLPDFPAQLVRQLGHDQPVVLFPVTRSCVSSLVCLFLPLPCFFAPLSVRPRHAPHAVDNEPFLGLHSQVVF